MKFFKKGLIPLFTLICTIAGAGNMENDLVILRFSEQFASAKALQQEELTGRWDCTVYSARPDSYSTFNQYVTFNRSVSCVKAAFSYPAFSPWKTPIKLEVGFVTTNGTSWGTEGVINVPNIGLVTAHARSPSKDTLLFELRHREKKGFLDTDFFNMSSPVKNQSHSQVNPEAYLAGFMYCTQVEEVQIPANPTSNSNPRISGF